MANERLDNPFYYLDNFLRVLDWLELRYADLLDPEERTFIAAFRLAPQAAQALLVRMVMRKGTLFRAGRLSYPEIGAIEEAAAVLLANGWLDDQAPIQLAQLFEVLLKPEVLRCFEGQLSQVSARKADLLAQLLEHSPQPQVFAAWCPQLNDTLYALRVQALCDRLRLLFFGNLHQDWTEFILADLGIYRYEQVALSDESRALRSRDDVHACVELHACRAVLEEGGDLQGVLARVNGLVTDNPWLLGRRDKLLLQMGQACERAADWPLALQLYTRCAHPRARQRRVRVLELSDRPAEALALANLALAAPQSAAEAQLIARALPRLRCKLGLPNPPRSKAAAVARLDLMLELDAARGSVEHRVREHLHEEQGPVHYVENSLLNSLFGLLCWPAIFAALPGAFFHPFQSGPADLHQVDFRQRRAALFDACFAQLDDGRYRATILEHYETKWGLQSPFVHWGALTPDILRQALVCLPAQHLRHCFERLLEDVQANRAGMPDLIQFWPQDQRYRMIEVKGPGDRLQDNQLRWLDFCAQHGMPVEVCYVQWASA